MSTATDSIRLLALAIRTEHDVVLCRQRARQLSSGLGFDSQDQVRIATAVSEIARNTFQYAGGGRVEFAVGMAAPATESGNQSLQMFTMTIKDEGPGIADLAGVLAGRVISKTGLGVGIVGTRRLMDVAEFSSSPQGTCVVLGKYLPSSAKPLSTLQLQKVVDDLSIQAPSSAVEEIQNQNQELLRLMDELRQRKDEIESANRELEETNAGVLALYDELETLHRVGMMLAAKVNLDELIQALIDTTTELTSAEWGAFYFRKDTHKPYKLQATSGAEEMLLKMFPDSLQNGEGLDFESGRMINVTDFGRQAEDGALPGWLIELQTATHFQSCLSVTVVDGEDSVIGCIVLGSAQPSVFSERAERIVGSIAVQAVVAVDKVRLFDKVKASSSAKDRFLAMLSHELRTPLTPVLAVISNMQAHAMLPDMFRADVEMALRNIKLETRIIDDLLDFHRLINGKFALEQTTVDVHEMVHHVLEICRVDIAEKEHEIVLEMWAPSATISGEPARVQQILWNLMKNAIKFTPSHGRIIVRSGVVESNLSVQIVDTGRGIPPEVLETIFTPFEQGDPSIALQFGGLGLGLSIAKAFVEKHGGTIAAHSEGAGNGVTMTITFPLLNPTLAALPEAAAGPKPDEVAKAAKFNILLVDDHRDTLSVLSRLLTARGHTVTTAASCAEAAKALNDQTQLIVSDVGLPDGTGYELIAKFRESTQVPAIAMSGFGMESDIEESRAAGFQAHLTKPVDLPRLLQLIQELGAA